MSCLPFYLRIVVHPLHYLIPYYACAHPHFLFVQVTTITNDDQFLLLACDGLFDVFTEEEVVEFVKENLEETGDPQKCCEALTDDAINNRNSRDNVSVILIILNKWY